MRREATTSTTTEDDCVGTWRRRTGETCLRRFEPHLPATWRSTDWILAANFADRSSRAKNSQGIWISRWRAE